MKKICTISFLILLTAFFIVSFKQNNESNFYLSDYTNKLNAFRHEQLKLIQTIQNNDVKTENGIKEIEAGINEARDRLKAIDFWLRYLEPNVYKKINGPLPVEWETEVFEKFEKPYKREGAGLTLAALYIDEENIQKDSLIQLVKSSMLAMETYGADSITKNLQTYDHFYLCNRLFLLNLAAIYTTGFECPDTARVIPELRLMMTDVKEIYRSFNQSFSAVGLNDNYLSLYEKAIEFVNNQPDKYSRFDHFTFIKNFINPLFTINQQLINEYKVYSRSFVDYSLNRTATSIFDKRLYNGLNPKGIFLRVDDKRVLDEIEKAGKLLFYDPILSANNKRSCASCHKTTEYFTDTSVNTAFQLNKKERLQRNTPSLVDVVYNHLAMQNGQHISLQDQAKAVITNSIELGSDEKKVLQKVLSCPEYKRVFQKLLQYTPTETEITFDHVVSAITLYYSKFSRYDSPFDEAVNNKTINLSEDAKHGFNLFMSKAQCATCHFVPQFNGVKPPYVGSEFEVLGVPSDTTFKRLDPDKGRYEVNPAKETLNAFRTGSLRNIMHTAPYMHNGVFKTMDEVIDFYDAGGGAGKGLTVNNQTLSSDSLHLTKEEKKNIIQFLQTLNENIYFEAPPEKLPHSKIKNLNGRKVGGEY